MRQQITVLKLGGSVLRSEKDLPRAVHQIYAHLRKGEQVLVVISAFGEATNELIAKTREFGDDLHPEATAALLLTGEATSAAMLAIALNRSGIPSKLLTPAQAGIRTAGTDPLDAEPLSANFDRIGRELASAVVIIPGFAGVNAEDDVTLLGRGGTDYTALFLANGLTARCVLLKDVGGLFEANPATASAPRRFIEASYDTLSKLGGELVQQKAVEFARQHELAFEIGPVDGSVSTLIGSVDDSLALTP